MTASTATFLGKITRLRADWKRLLVHAWSARALYALFLVNFVDVSCSFFIGYAPIPQWVMGLIVGSLTVAALYARIVLQERLHAPETDHAG